MRNAHSRANVSSLFLIGYDEAFPVRFRYQGTQTDDRRIAVGEFRAQPFVFCCQLLTLDCAATARRDVGTVLAAVVGLVI